MRLASSARFSPGPKLLADKAVYYWAYFAGAPAPPIDDEDDDAVTLGQPRPLGHHFAACGAPASPHRSGAVDDVMCLASKATFRP